MQFNRDQFIEEGYLVLREVVPPAELDALRTGYEQMVDRPARDLGTRTQSRRPTGAVYGKQGHSRGWQYIGVLC